MVEFTLTVDSDIMEAYADMLDDSPLRIELFMENTVTKEVKADVEAINQYPGPVAQPIEWANQIPTPPGKISNILGGLWSRQKAAYFASDGFGAGIPYERKGTFWKDTIVDWNPAQGVLTIINFNPIAKYVVGMFQQPFHRNTGWPKTEDEYLEILIKTQDRLIEEYIESVDVKNLI